MLFQAVWVGCRLKVVVCLFHRSTLMISLAARAQLSYSTISELNDVHHLDSYTCYPTRNIRCGIWKFSRSINNSFFLTHACVHVNSWWLMRVLSNSFVKWHGQSRMSLESVRWHQTMLLTWQHHVARMALPPSPRVFRIVSSTTNIPLPIIIDHPLPSNAITCPGTNHHPRPNELGP